MTDPVQEPDAARECERLAGEIVRMPDKLRRLSTYLIVAPGRYDPWIEWREALNKDAASLEAFLRASEPVPGAVGVSVEDIDRSLRELGAIDLANYQHRRIVADALLILVTPRTVEPDPASGAGYAYQSEPISSVLAARPSSPRDVGEAETVEIMPRLGGVANWHATAVLERRKRRSAEARVADLECALEVREGCCREAEELHTRVADLERQIAGAESYIKATLKFYDDLDAPHHPGEAKVLDELVTFLASLKETPRGE